MTVIVIALDGSSAAKSAVDVVRTCCPGARLTLLTVLPAPHDTSGETSVGTPQWHWPGSPETRVHLAETREQAIDRLHAETTDRLGSLAAELSGEGFTVDTAVAFGEPVHEILATAGRVGADMIAVASHGRSALGVALLGSVAAALVHARQLPVLVAPRADAI